MGGVAPKPTRGGFGLKKSFIAAATALLLAGCAINAPLNQKLDRKPDDTLDYTFAKWLASRQAAAGHAQALPDTLVVLSFSGGGSRAAAVASGVLELLEDRDLGPNIALISSTSGGSVAGAAYASQGPDGLKKLDKFLAANNTRVLAPRLVPRLFIPGANRGVEFAKYLDAELFTGNPPSYRSLAERWTTSPFLIVNATDMSSGRTFEFTQESFSELCSDLAAFPITRAVAASASFPFLLNPLPLENFWTKVRCDPYRMDDTLARLKHADRQENRYRSPEDLARAQYAWTLETSRKESEEKAPPRQVPDPLGGPPLRDRNIEFIHLLDGGLSDNLAARGVMRVLGAHLPKIQDMGVKYLVLIQVNAKTAGSQDYDHSSAIPGWLDVFKSVAFNPIDVATELSAYSSRLYTVALVDSIKPPDPTRDKISVVTMPIDFTLLKRPDRMRAQAIGTNWKLDMTPENGENDLEFLKRVGRQLLQENDCFAQLISRTPVSCAYADMVVAPPPGAFAQAPSAPPPAPASVRPPLPAPAPAPAPAPPAATKVTYAADAFFDFDKAVLKPEGRATLDNLVAKIQDINLEVVIAVGHTDSVGPDGYNQRLAVRRAEAVKAYLVSKGIERNRVFTEGHGEKQPVADNATPGGRSKNRRVEIEVVGSRQLK
jgi:OOP family OmpA-OmpF porin